ncbi:orotate phosphoribosyltransferase [Mycobacterium sp.]|uniref:orotate phosphoribosyltransferase n=1 Tax=Mycobacterium sp. TaxID=1785 RepID=UPI003A8B7531
MNAVTTRPDSWQAVRDLVKNIGHEYRQEPFLLASGRKSHDYIDGKHAVAYGDNLMTAARAIADLAAARDIEFDAVGGLTMGADAIAIAVAVVAHKDWFSVRKERKKRGLDQYIEGARFEPGVTRVLVVDDVVTSGGSIGQACSRAREAGATVTGVIPMVDRGDAATKLFAELGLPYFPLVTYGDLGIEPV